MCSVAGCCFGRLKPYMEFIYQKFICILKQTVSAKCMYLVLMVFILMMIGDQCAASVHIDHVQCAIQTLVRFTLCNADHT